jgi:hypothetical protein
MIYDTIVYFMAVLAIFPHLFYKQEFSKGMTASNIYVGTACETRRTLFVTFKIHYWLLMVGCVHAAGFSLHILECDRKC